MKLKSIQILRGFAALLVVFFHLIHLEGLMIQENASSESPLVGGLFTNGFAGVDLFFVISGFIMVYVTKSAGHGARPATEFLFARVTRIYPVWWLFAGAMAAYMIGFHGLSGLGEGWDVISRTEPLIPYLVKSFLLLPQGEHPILGVGWTLVHEMYFYVVFTCFMFLPRRHWPYLLALWMVAVLAGSLMGLSSPVPDNFLALAVYPMTAEFILGAVTGLLVTSGRSWRTGALTLMAILWMTASLCLQGVETRFTLGWGRVLWFGLPSALLVYGFAMIETQKRLAWLVPAGVGALVFGGLFQLYGINPSQHDSTHFGAVIVCLIVGAMAMLAILWGAWLMGQSMPQRLRHAGAFFLPVRNALSRLGDWSYSLYLCHMLVLSALRLAFVRLGDMVPLFKVGTPGILDNLIFLVVGIGASIIVSGLAYHLYERQCVRLFGAIRRWLFGPRKSGVQSA